MGSPKKQSTRRSSPANRAGLSAASLLAVVCLVAQGFAAQGGGAGAAADLKVLPPASGEVFVENRRGGLRVEVWEGPEVSLSFEAARPPAGRRPRSPVSVERAENLLSIRVARATAADAGRVDLTVRVPPSARLTARTADGELSVEGLPAALAAQTVSGGLRLSLPAPPDARATAQSLNGSVALGAGVEAAGSAPREVRGKFQAVWGGGGREVNLFSGRGRVEINMRAGRAAAEAARGDVGAGARRAPSLKGAPAGSGASGGMSSAPQQTRASDDPQEVGEDEVIRVESDLVTLNFNVVERASGRGVGNLTASDFRLFEDNAEQRVEHFESAEAPFDLVLALDLSGSTVRVTDIIRAAALRFVSAARPQDRVAVIAFAGESAVVSPLTSDRRALRSAVERMARPEGGTRLYDSLASALDFAERGADPARRRAVVLMSDGLDSSLPNVEGEGSALAYAELLGRAREFDGVLYTVWTSTEYEAFSPEDVQPETFDIAHDRMAELAEAGGGLFYSVGRLEDLAGAYERVVADLGTVYSLTYRPTNRLRDGAWRAIRVTLPRRPEAVARGRRGYFAR